MNDTESKPPEQESSGDIHNSENSVDNPLTVKQRGNSKIGEIGKATRFSSTRQVSGEVKKEAWKKKRVGSELARMILESKLKGAKAETMKQEIAAFFGVSVKSISVGAAGTFRLAEKMIKKADSRAFKELNNRAYGAPAQDISLSGPDGGPIQTESNIKSEIDFTQLPDSVIEALLNARIKKAD